MIVHLNNRQNNVTIWEHQRLAKANQISQILLVEIQSASGTMEISLGVPYEKTMQL